ncbi:hypothetical protein CJ010_16390 [Azoarcus sp. DD4]|uniref:hypothetical protein n=1 Tax=Azoarcus sp. DD4 TaxID=2027405 RepID=UPI00112D0C29|nr:hypothetical protein [Azoarcus sp. DD4]QDF97996.1 hypothetical protein CJ010_16390 [Azoarcus sp. DD4]
MVCATTLAAAPPTTVIEPPGDNLPPAGASLFDHVLAGEPTVPFPITALLQHIARQLDARQANGGLSIVLIPLGRSLQRHAAGDVEAFRYPRVVAAVTGEPPAQAGAGHLYLKDRLYIAYHEKSTALEVISYNERAGRFEFQLVRDYRAGGRPQVGYADRALCLACHHNAAPIFSRQSWDETSASPPVAARLAAAGQDFYGLPWRHGVDVPDAIDNATARANLFLVAQRLWQQACGEGEAGIACRAASLRLALRYRLAGERPIMLDGERGFIDHLLANWRQRWPAGIAIADPTLPNRQPFADVTHAGDDPHRLADVPAAFDPLALRAPLEHWRGRDHADARRYLHLLSQFFSQADIRLLDHQLAGRAVAGRTLDLTCTTRPSADGSRLDLDCAATDGSRLLARLDRAGARYRGGSIDRLVLAGQDVGAVALAPPGTDGKTQHFHLQRGTLALRSASGEAIRKLVLVPPDAAATTATARLELAADLAPLDAAVDELARATLAGRSDALDALPLRRDAVLPPLLAGLGIKPPHRPAPPAMPVLAVPPAARSTPWPAELQAFVRQCGQCHAADTAFPPAFLRGGDATVRASLAACAPRIAYRLAMNALPPAARPKVPMPPPAAAHAAGFAESADLRAMQATLAALSGHPLPATLPDRPYASLAPCAPARPH